MGIASDYYEDAQERMGQLLDEAMGLYELARKPAKIEVKPRWYVCPVCAWRFSAEGPLQAHVFECHRRAHVYLHVNGKVCSQSAITITAPVRELSLHFVARTRSPLVAINVIGDGGNAQQNQIAPQGHSCDLTHYLPAWPIRNIYLSIFNENDVAKVDRSFAIEVLSRTVIGPSLDPLVEQLEKEMESNPRGVDWAKWETEFRQRASNQSEWQYLSGQYDYLYGYWLECTQGPHPRVTKLYENAYGSLLDFTYQQGKATVVCSAIAFKLGWFKTLLERPLSKFYLPAYFFSHSYKEVLSLRRDRMDPQSQLAASLDSTRKLRKVQVFLDDFHILLLKAVHHFCNGQDELLFNVLQELQEYQLAGLPIGYADKLFLLLARFYRLKGGSGLAAKFYYRLSNPTPYEEEVRELDRA